MLSILRVHLASDIPVVGVELNPYIVLKSAADGAVSTEDITENNPVNGCYLLYKWFRIQNNEKLFCSVHPSIPATLQCACCLRLRIPLHKTYHCTAQCYKTNWRHHKLIHSRAANTGKEETDDEFETRMALDGLNGRYEYAQTNDGVYSSFPSLAEGQKQPNGEVWFTVGRSKYYTPTPDDIGFTLRLECCSFDSNTNSSGPSSSLSTEKVIPAPTPVPRRMINFRTLQYADEKSRIPGSFTVMTYNILAELYTSNEMYSYCPPWALAWPYRRQNIIKEIRGYSPDFVCLQEVQSDHYEKFFVGAMQSLGYDCKYMKKSREMYTANNTYTIDGCATFYKKNRWREVANYQIDFSKQRNASPEDQMTNIEKGRLLKDNCASIIILEDLYKEQGEKRTLCVANTHITANPELKDVKMWQISLLGRGLEGIAKNIGCPIVITGDFNSVPGSAAYVLMTTGRIDPSHPEWTVDPTGILKPGKTLGHSMTLESVYPQARGLSGPVLEKLKRRLDNFNYEPLFTNCTRDFTGTLDYIFYTSDSLNVEGVLELMDEADLRKNTGLPSPEWPSDHIALMAEFTFLRR